MARGRSRGRCIHSTLEGKAPPFPSAYPSKLVRRWAERECARPTFELACLEHCYATIFAKQMFDDVQMFERARS